MNSRERFLHVVEFRAPDVVPLPSLWQCFDPETITRWQREGLRRDAQPTGVFGFERMELAPVVLGPLPATERADLEHSQEWRAGTDREHAEEATQRLEAARERFPLQARADWPTMRSLLNPDSPARYPRFWDDYCRGTKGRDYPLGIQMSGPFSSLVDWLGLRRLGAVVTWELDWLASIVEYMADFVVKAAGRAVRDLSPDFAVVREPWANRAAVIGSTDVFADLCAPFYRTAAGFLREGGIPVVVVEARGAVADLIPTWLANGANGLAFLEAAAGLDALALRQRYGKQLVLIGNVDHQALTRQERHIADEVMVRVPDLLKQGGYFPTPDRPVSSEVSLGNYEYYLSLLRRLNF